MRCTWKFWLHKIFPSKNKIKDSLLKLNEKLKYFPKSKGKKLKNSGKSKIPPKPDQKETPAIES